VPSNIRATLFFTSDKYGWSETFFKVADDLQAVLEDAVRMAVNRIRLCGTNVELDYVRVSDDDIRRDSLVAQPNLTAQLKKSVRDVLDVGGEGAKPKEQKINVAAPDPADQPYSAILLRMEAGPLYRRPMYLRGCPDSIIVNPPGPVQPKEWGDMFRRWVEFLKGNAWGFKVLNRDVGNPAKPITASPGVAPFQLTVAAHGLVQGQRVTVEDIKGEGAVPHGAFTIDVVDPNTIRLRGTTGAFTYDRGGTVRLRVYKVATISSIIIRGETTRRTGRPFDSPRGRRRTAR
jgi:hypothetical protein